MRKLFILFALLLASFGARADGVPKSSWGGYSTPEAACTAAAGSNPVYCRAQTLGSPVNQVNCFGTVSGSCSDSFQYTTIFLSATCPKDHPVVGADGKCWPKDPVKCPDGSYADDAASCQKTPKCTDDKGQKVTWTQFRGHSASSTAALPDSGTVGPYPLTSPTCTLQGVPDVTRCYAQAGKSGGLDFYCTYSGVSAGIDAPDSVTTTDVGSTVPSDSTPAKENVSANQTNGSCPGGTVQAGADSSGIPICIGSGTDPVKAPSSSTTTPTTTTTNADGSTTSVSSTSTTNSDGSVTTVTTTTVKGADGSVKTTQSSVTSNNPAGGTGKSDEAKDFCAAHPELTVCQNSSVSGSCGQISCNGDAIQCATLRAAAAMQCAQQQDIDALKAMSSKALGDQIMAGADPMSGQISDMLKGTDVDMSRVSFDQSGFLGGGSCLSNRSITVMGQVIPVDFTTVCSNIAPLRAVMMAVAFILAYLIVGRSVVGS